MKKKSNNNKSTRAVKKISFNDKYGLTEAVLTGRKTMTRRAVRLPDGLKPQDVWNPTMGIDERGRVYFTFDCIDGKQRDIYPQCQPGEVVAVAQSYKAIYDAMEESEGNSKANDWWCGLYDHIGDGLGPAVTPGYRNKMFVRAELMPRQIRITDIKAERLQDISWDDCLREGIEKILEPGCRYPSFFVSGIYSRGLEQERILYTDLSPRVVFASLIDRISGRGTWQSNPWEFAFAFENVK